MAKFVPLRELTQSKIISDFRLSATNSKTVNYDSGFTLDKVQKAIE